LVLSFTPPLEGARFAVSCNQNRKPTRIFIPDHPEEIYAGFSMEAILDVLKKGKPGGFIKTFN